MRGQLNSTPQNLPGTDATSSATGMLSSLEGQLSQLRARGYTDRHPDVVALLNQIAQVRPQAAAERRSGGGGITNPSYVSLRAMLAERESQLQALTNRRNQIQSDLAQLGSRQSTEPGLAAEQDRLNNDYNVLKQQYDQLLANREQVRLRSDVQSRTSPLNIQVVEPPSVPGSPAAPNRPLFLTLILIVGVGCGIAAAFVAGQVQTTFPTLTRLASVTGLPVLGSISEVLTPPEKSRRRQRLVLLGGAGAGLAASYAVLVFAEFWSRMA
jgi:uncharacterized protein involved in exopolysaccharide biosynthesis